MTGKHHIALNIVRLRESILHSTLISSEPRSGTRTQRQRLAEEKDFSIPPGLFMLRSVVEYPQRLYRVRSAEVTCLDRR
jgi:hypothetical protein